MPKLTDRLLHDFRDKVHEGNRIWKLYRNRNGKNKWSIICSAMDWIQVTVEGIDTDSLIRDNSDEASRRMICFVSYIDVLWEGIIQLHRVFFNTKEEPLKNDHSIFKQKDDDNDHFKTIRAVFAAHQVNLYDFKPKAFASWSGGGIGHGDFSVILYSIDPEKVNQTFDIYFDDLFKFAESRYHYLYTLMKEIHRQIEEDNKFWRSQRIPERKENVLAHIELLKEENEKRLENEWIKERLEEIWRIFSIKITDEDNEMAVDQFRKALLSDLDYYQNCLQTMCFDDDHQDIEGNCPQRLSYARQQISELDNGLFWPAVREMMPYLKDAVKLEKAKDMLEIQVLVEAGLWIKQSDRRFTYQ